VDSSQFQAALQLELWVNMVKDGSASKSVLTWGQDPDLTQPFLHSKAAIIEDGPWIFPELNSAGWKYNDQYGIVPIPLNTAGDKLTTPLGGETLDIGAGGSSAQQQAAWEWVQGMQQPTAMQYMASHMYYRRQSRHGPARSSTGPPTRRSRRRSGPLSSPRSPAPPR
jgi:multiple sugar transport system substrate-binding protein